MKFNLGNSYSVVYSSNDKLIEDYEINGNNIIYVVQTEELFKRKVGLLGKDKVFFKYFWMNGARFSNILHIGESFEASLRSGAVPEGTVLMQAHQSTNFLRKSLIKHKNVFKQAEEIVQAKKIMLEFKKEKKRTKKEISEHPKNALASMNNSDFMKDNDLSFDFCSFIMSVQILYMDNYHLVVKKNGDYYKTSYIKAYAEFYNLHKDFIDGEDTEIISELSDDLFVRKHFEKTKLPFQPISSHYLGLLSRGFNYNNEDLVPKWENDSNREVEKPVLPLPNAHLVNALTSGLLQGDLYTDRGDALIKGSTLKVTKKNGDVEEEYFENRQMVFYKDEYTLSHENSSNFIEANLKELNKMLKGIGSIIDPTNVTQLEPFLDILSKGNRVDLPGQIIKTIGNFVAQNNYNFSIYNGEPGIGKTQVSFSVCNLLLKTKYTKGMKTLFVTDGAKHLHKMVEEAEKVLGDNVTTKIVRNLNDIDDMVNDVVPDNKVFVYILSKDTAKRQNKMIQIKSNKCPNCGAFFTKRDVDTWNKRLRKENDDIILKRKSSISKNKSISSCASCGEKIIFPLTRTNTSGNFRWGAKKAKTPYLKEKGLKPKESFGKYLRRKLKWKKAIDFLIIDEAHNMSSDASNQTQLMRDLIKISRNKMLMTGTLSNGYASSLYYLLYSVMPKRLKEWGFDIQNQGLIKWIDAYGARKRVSNKKGKGTPQEKAVINPALIMHHLSPFTIWGKIEDLNYPMPRYSESVTLAPIENEVIEKISNLQKEAKTVIQELNIGRGEVDRIKPSLAGLTKAMLYISNNPFKEYSIPLRYRGEELARLDVPAIYTNENFVTGKEQKLLDIIKDNLDKGRKVMVYTYFNETAFANLRLAKVLENNMPSVSFGILSKSVKSENLNDWFVSASKKHDVVLVPYKRVATGLDIPQYPEVVFYEEEYNIREIIQASRRPYRAVVQKNDVHITHLCHNGVQAIAMKLISEKIAASKIVEGEIYSEDGVESFAVDSIEIELAQRLSEGLNDLEVPDFADLVIEEGRARPWTSLEQRYIDLLEENNIEAFKIAVPEKTEDVDIEVETEIILDEEVPQYEELEFEFCETTQSEYNSNQKIVERIEIEPIEFGFEVLTRGKKTTKIERTGKVKGISSDIQKITEELSSNEKIQLTFF